MTTKFNDGDEVYSKRLKIRLTIEYISNDYAYCTDEHDNSYTVHVSDLQPIQWSPDEIIRREG